MDGITFSNLTIGAFGPYIRFQNGSFWKTSWVERPQVTQAKDGTPLAFFVGMGRTSYDDSCSWAQLFCKKGQASSECGPMLPPPPPPPPPATNVTYSLQRGGNTLCMGTNESFPCPG